jgi:ATP-dependent Zn protease
MRVFYFFLIITLLFSCKNEKALTPKDLKTGTFKTVLDGKNVSSIAIRNNRIQVETYNNKKDTFYINWKTDFEYELKQKNPKNSLDSIPFVVKITGIHGQNYTFKAHYKGNKYIQKGTATKLKIKK